MHGYRKKRKMKLRILISFNTEQLCVRTQQAKWPYMDLAGTRSHAEFIRNPFTEIQWCRVVGIVIRTRAGWSNPGRGKRFFSFLQNAQTISGAQTAFSYTETMAFLPGVKRLGCDVDQSPPFSTNAKNESIIPPPSYAFVGSTGIILPWFIMNCVTGRYKNDNTSDEQTVYKWLTIKRRKRTW